MRISDVFGMLTSVYNDWGDILANPNYVRSDNQITWPRRERIDVIQTSDIARLAEARQYSFQTTEDGSLIQLYYEFENNNGPVKAASLAYYGAPSSTVRPEALTSDVDIDLAQLGQTEVIANLKWLRIDFDPNTARGALHHECHLHLSNFTTSRLMVRRLPTPKQFVEFILALCHSDVYKRHRLDESGAYRDKARIQSVNEPSFVCDQDDLFGQLMHLRTPGG